jgi:hypothetical protein
MPRPLSATIHTAALANNLAVVRRYAPNSKIWAVVKANDMASQEPFPVYAQRTALDCSTSKKP